MSQEESESFLQRMRELIKEGKKHFVKRNRNGKDYLEMLAKLRLSSTDEAWEYVQELNKDHYNKGPEIDIAASVGSAPVIWIFKTDINGILTYIKLKDESTGRGCVCMSFHEDEP